MKLRPHFRGQTTVYMTTLQTNIPFVFYKVGGDTINNMFPFQVEVRRDDSALVNFYCFTQQTLQEFLAALRIMTSQRVSNDQLKRR